MATQKILVITPRFPFDLRGACEQDRAHGITLLKKLGYDVHVVTMCYKSHLPLTAQAEKDFGIQITPVLYKKERAGNSRNFFDIIKRITTPAYWDGAAFEYADTETRSSVEKTLKSYKPDLVWFDYTYLWPLYDLVTQEQIPIITRSINYEPDHFYNKSPKTPLNWLKYKAKCRSELRVIRESNHVFAITPKEEATYRALGATHVSTLPLRRLGEFIGADASIHDRDKLNLFFMGSNYTVHHMLQALRFILDAVNPLLQKTTPNVFTLHIIGGKMPESILHGKHDGVVFHGYIPDLNAFLADMDIALAPSLSGEGMQQKVFEPIVRGIPTVTSTRALAEYPLVDGVHVHALQTDDAALFVEALLKLKDARARKAMSEQAVTRAHDLFSEVKTSTLIQGTIRTLI